MLVEPRAHRVAWGGVAVLLGILVARLPVMVAGGGVVVTALLVAILIEPALALLLMLCVAPLKTLIATEAPLALPVDVGQITFVLAVGAWALWRVTQKPHTPLPRTRLYLPLIGFMVVFGPSLFVARSTGSLPANVANIAPVRFQADLMSECRLPFTPDRGSSPALTLF